MLVLSSTATHAQTSVQFEAAASRQILVSAPADAVLEYKDRMRNALATQAPIMAAILGNDFKQAGKLASDAFGAGMVAVKGQPMLARHMPEEMKALSRQMQGGAEEFAALSQNNHVTQKEMLTAYTEKILSRCSACHSVIRLNGSILPKQ